VIDCNAAITAYLSRIGAMGDGRERYRESIAIGDGFVPCAVEPVSARRLATLQAREINADLMLHVDLAALRLAPGGVEKVVAGDRLAVRVDGETTDEWWIVNDATRDAAASRGCRTGADIQTLALARARGQFVIDEPSVPGNEVVG
jgi:hypothetical protein